MSDTAIESQANSPENGDPRVRTELLERELADLRELANIRLIHAEMKIEAIRAGMIDLDGLKLLDLSDAKLNDKGEVPDAAERMIGLKKAKPWLFGIPPSSSPLTPPSAQPMRQKHAKEMTAAEYSAARSALLKHSY